MSYWDIGIWDIGIINIEAHARISYNLKGMLFHGIVLSHFAYLDIHLATQTTFWLW